MITRIWRGWTSPSNADAFESLPLSFDLDFLCFLVRGFAMSRARGFSPCARRSRSWPIAAAVV